MLEDVYRCGAGRGSGFALAETMKAQLIVIRANEKQSDGLIRIYHSCCAALLQSNAMARKGIKFIVTASMVKFDTYGLKRRLCKDGRSNLTHFNDVKTIQIPGGEKVTLCNIAAINIWSIDARAHSV